MSGNVWEWSWDWDGDLPTTAQTNYLGAGSGNSRVKRGGCYDFGAISLQVGYRRSYTPYSEDSIYGLRVTLP